MQFFKVHGLGNDFILLDHTNGEQMDYCAAARILCDRHVGIGGDGLLVVQKSDVSDLRMRIFNNDGNEAEMCGNGIRAFAKYVYEAGLIQKERFDVETLAGIMRPSLAVENGKVISVTIDMGEPFLDCTDIPVVGAGRCIDRAITVSGRTVHVTSVLVGVPHTIVFVDDPTQEELMALGKSIEHAPIYPKRTNVDFVQVLDNKHIVMRTWERGCGPTLACGTGACSAAVACALNGKTGRSVEVQLALGTLSIEWAQDNHIYMTGPADIVFTGDITL